MKGFNMGNLSRLVPSWTNLLIIPGIIAGFTVHELAHTFVAYFFGDLSQVERGRITLNPLRHISWFGTLTFVFFGFGWARPVRVDSRHFKRRYLGMFLVAISGAAANLLLAGATLILTLVLVTLVALFSQQSPAQVLSLLLNVEPTANPGIVVWTAAFTTYPVYANLALAFFNLLPFPTLDGFTALASLVGMLRSHRDQLEEFPARRQPARADQHTASRSGSQRQPADIHFDLGAKYHAASNYEDAIARYRQAITNDRHYGPAYINMGLVYLALDQRDRAIQAFRGAAQYATDEKSKNEAWAQLQKLSEFRPPTAQDIPALTETEPPQALHETGPWTHTRPTPNWLAFGLSSLLTLAGTGCVYIYLTIGLIHYLS
jgi:Zn-dependent protease